MLANIPIQSLGNDYALMNEAKNDSAGFYLTLDQGTSPEGIDLRGIHLILKRHSSAQAAIIGVTSVEWNKIRGNMIHGKKDQLYSLFP